MDDALYIAVDLGAGSGRVFLAGVAPGELLLEEVRRFHYPPFESSGHLRWNLARIVIEIKAGLSAAGARAKQLGRRVHSIGVDSWGVDYGLIDASGLLIEEPICYRDKRTQGVMEQVFDTIGRNELFTRTGIQFLVFNTIFQLYAHARAGIPERAARLLLVPDLINFFLSGRAVTEYTNATTTQMVNAETGQWDFSLLSHLQLPLNLLPEILPAGSEVGPLSPEVADELDLPDVTVVAPATHDTGSAIAGTPLQNGWAYISSGTWSLVGIERDRVLINDEVARHNFTNEGGAYGRIRFLKNVMGLWILECCRAEWQQQGLSVDHRDLLDQVASMGDSPAFIFPDDGRFLKPPRMLDALAVQLIESGQRVPAEPAVITKVILDSLAFRYASVLRTAESLNGTKLRGVHIVGGGSLNDYLNQATANATGLPVLAGPVESTVIGNVIVQAIASNRFESLSAARKHIANNVQLKQFRPSPSGGESARRYAAVEDRFLGLG
jgi:rhamnulokinase